MRGQGSYRHDHSYDREEAEGVPMIAPELRDYNATRETFYDEFHRPDGSEVAIA